MASSQQPKIRPVWCARGLVAQWGGNDRELRASALSLRPWWAPAPWDGQSGACACPGQVAGHSQSFQQGLRWLLVPGGRAQLWEAGKEAGAELRAEELPRV